MAGITLAIAEESLAFWIEEEKKAQSYSIAGRTVTRHRLNEIAERISFWKAEVQNLSTTTGGKRWGGIPVDD